MIHVIRFPKIETRQVLDDVKRNDHKWGFLELFESTMNRDLHTGNPWMDKAEAWRIFQTKIKTRRKKVTFNLIPIVYTISRSTEEDDLEY